MNAIFDLSNVLNPLVSDLDVCKLQERLQPVENMETLKNLGIVTNGAERPTILVASLTRPIGSFTVECHRPGATIVFDNRNDAKLNLHGRIRFFGKNCTAVFADMTQGISQLSDVVLRSPGQLFFWGSGSTSVDSRIEVEGENKRIIVGDDCLLSSGIWIRNYDMHAVVDLETNTIVNSEPGDITIQQHVWIAAEVLVLNAGRIGYGSVIGAKSLLKDSVEPKSAFAGVPAKCVKRNVSWDRSARSIHPLTLELIKRLNEVAAGEN